MGLRRPRYIIAVLVPPAIQGCAEKREATTRKKTLGRGLRRQSPPLLDGGRHRRRTRIFVATGYNRHCGNSRPEPPQALSLSALAQRLAPRPRTVEMRFPSFQTYALHAICALTISLSFGRSSA